jgi:hypothetical protein
MAEPAFTELDHVTELYAISEKENRDLKRKLHRLENQMNKVSEDSPDAKDVLELLELWWRKIMGANEQVAHDLDSTRAPKIRTAKKRRGMEMCRKAILGVEFDDWAMGRISKTGGKKFNDIAEHILNTDGDIEKFAGLFDKHYSLITGQPMAPEVVQSIERASQKRERDFQRNAARWTRLEVVDPAEAILAALTRAGRDWKPSGRDGWVAQCPAHDGTDLKLSIDWNGAGDRLLLKCWSRDCEVPYIMDALGLPLSALFKHERAA